MKHRMLLWMLLIFGTWLSADSQGEKPPFTFEDEIVVVGEAVEETATVSVITSTELIEQGVKTVAEALEWLPGVHVRIGDRGESFIRLRGFRQREVAVLIDGIPVSSPYDGQLDLSNLPVDSIARIEVVKGASSVLYGSNAMGGVVNIITRRSDGRSRYSFHAEYGSGESFTIGGSAQGSLGKLRFFVAGEGFFRDNYPLANDYTEQPNQVVGVRENSDRKGWNGRISLGWDMGRNGQASFNVSRIDLEKGLPHHESDRRPKFRRYNEWQENIVDFVYEHFLGAVALKSKVYYQTYETVLDGYDDRNYITQDGNKAFTDTVDDYAVGGDVFMRYLASDTHLFKMAFRARHDVHREQPNTDEPWDRFSADTFSIPVEGEWLPCPHFTLTYGASFDFMSFNTIETTKRRTTRSFNPQLAGLFTVNEALQFHVSAARKTRFPNLKELYSSQSGNPYLNPMKANVFEVGLKSQAFPEVRFSLVGFYNQVKDLIDRDTNQDPYLNIDEAVFKGIEATTQWQPTDFVQFYLGYTWLDAQDLSTAERKYIQYRPRHKFDCQARLLLPARFRFNVRLTHVSSQVFYDDDQQYELDRHTLMDVKLSKMLKKRLELYVRVHNLFDELYYESEGMPREGRMIFGGIRFQFE